MRNRVQVLFHQVVDLSAEARAQFFAERAVDTATRTEVEALLAFDLRASSLDEDIGRVAQGALARIDRTDIACGPYQLGKLLGRGGMGTVHLAARVDGEVTQQVAVKLLRPGADDPILRQRFLSERQILANLSHPNIARLLDAGHREDGQPYLVMEYVEGQPIDEFSSVSSTWRKVTLFLKVCAAVSYLHRNLVVHRDLKPPNILVSHDGEPKLLDFGIAKMLDLGTDSTVTSLRMLTPDYASPEQVAGAPMTTATDIYSLGAVLYKLLTGTSPHQFGGDSAVAIAVAISSGKITPPSKLAPEIKSDLEMIVMKALRREPQQRYATVEQFSEDLENFLASRPIRARRGDAWYQTRKFLRMHWLPAAAATLAITGLAGGVLVANHQRAIAQRRFVQVRQLSNKLFDIDYEVRRTPGTTKARELIVNTSLEYLQRLAEDARGDPDLALEVGNAYLRVARVQGVPVAQNLGQMDRAEKNLNIAERFIQSVLAAQPGNRTAYFRSAQINHDLMLLARYNSHSSEALAFARKSAGWLDKFQAGKQDKSEASAVLNTYFNVADEEADHRQFSDALRLCSRAKDLTRILNRPDYLGNFVWVSADVLRQQGELDQALRETREAARLLESHSDFATQSDFILTLIYEGRILGQDNALSLGRPQEAIVALERALRTADDWVHRDASDQASRSRLAMAGIPLADILCHSDPTRALEIYDHVLPHLREIRNNVSFERFEVNALVNSSYSLRHLGRPGEARQRLDAAFDLLERLELYPAEKIQLGSEAEDAVRALADYEAGTGNLRRALEIYETLREQVQAAKPNPAGDLKEAVRFSTIYRAEAAIRQKAGQPERAAGMEADIQELWRHWDAKLPNNSFVRRQLEAATPPRQTVARRIRKPAARNLDVIEDCSQDNRSTIK